MSSASSVVSSIISERRESQVEAESSDEKYYHVTPDSGGVSLNFLDLKLRGGHRTALSYSDLIWVNYDADESTLDLDFNGILVTIKGRGLVPRLYDKLLTRSVWWIREQSDSDSALVEAEPITIENIIISVGSDES